jgi:ABC-type transport system substrate-binding protein
MEPLIFYGRIDDIHRRRAAEMLTEEMTNIGIPVVLNITGRRQCVQEVMVNREYHLYTGGWSQSRDPDLLPWLYGSIGYLDPGTLCNNYPGFINATYDYWADKILHSLSHDEIKEAVFKCQEILADQAGIIPILSPVSVKAYRTDWEGVVNEVGRGVDSWWTFLNAHPINITKGGTIRWGFQSDIESLNPVYATTAWDCNVLGEIYDTLLKYNPYNVTEDIPWMAKSYEVGTWFNPDTGTICTKLTFQLPTDIYFHDAVQCTAEDVKFTIDYLKQFPEGYWYWAVTDVHHVDTPAPFTVVVYENITSYWTLHWIGELPILPKHIWKDIGDPTGFAPDPHLIGSGPFNFTEYVPGHHIALQRNPEYRVRTHLHDVAVVSLTSSVTEAYVGQIVNITVVVRNEGTANETFSVTAYYDNTPIGTQGITNLKPGTKTLTFIWDTTGVAPGDYKIKAETSVVAGETDIGDNTLADGTVKVQTLRIVTVIPCNQTGNPQGIFETGTMAYFKVTINHTAIGPANALITINVYDSNGATIGVTSFQGPIMSGVSVFILGLPIPTSASHGVATVYANAFTDWPHLGGVPYCPEASATFEITGP